MLVVAGEAVGTAWTVTAGGATVLMAGVDVRMAGVDVRMAGVDVRMAGDDAIFEGEGFGSTRGAAGFAPHVTRTVEIACRSAEVTHNRYLALTATCRAT